jgi:hypothetical protein
MIACVKTALINLHVKAHLRRDIKLLGDTISVENLQTFQIAAASSSDNIYYFLTPLNTNTTLGGASATLSTT